ncbi:MAG: DUF4157 domain-containing protein, partial [Ignavibacteria bacterium]|nr:DUF4157 domain-containing protein [Ignavibacteria bacterium]
MQLHENSTSQRKASFSVANIVGFTAIQKKAIPVNQQGVKVPQLQKDKSVNFVPFQLKENKTGMPDNLKSGVENLSGLDMSDVKVHYNSSQPAQFNALAYAQGNEIHLGAGQERHLPHEAWHVVQQRQSRAQATKQMKVGVPINDDAGLENEADVMGAKALSLGTEPLQRKYEHSPLPTEAADNHDMNFEDDWEEVEAPEKQNISKKDEVWGTAKIEDTEDTELQNMNVEDEWEIVEKPHLDQMEEGEEE